MDDLVASVAVFAKEQEHRHQNLVETLADVRCQSAQKVAQEPADQNGGQLEADSPHNGAGNNVADRSGILTEGKAKIAMDRVLAENQKLLGHGLIGAELFGIVLINLLHSGGVGHTGSQLTGDSGNRVSRHQTGQEEVQKDCDHERDQEPDDFFTKIFTVALHATDPPLSKQEGPCSNMEHGRFD